MAKSIERFTFHQRQESIAAERHLLGDLGITRQTLHPLSPYTLIERGAATEWRNHSRPFGFERLGKPEASERTCPRQQHSHLRPRSFSIPCAAGSKLGQVVSFETSWVS